MAYVLPFLWTQHSKYLRSSPNDAWHIESGLLHGCYEIIIYTAKLRVLYSSCSGKGRWEPFFWERLPGWWAITISIIINSQLQGSRELSSTDDRRTNTLILDWQVQGSLWGGGKYGCKIFFLHRAPRLVVTDSWQERGSLGDEREKRKEERV